MIWEKIRENDKKRKGLGGKENERESSLTRDASPYYYYYYYYYTIICPLSLLNKYVWKTLTKIRGEDTYITFLATWHENVIFGFYLHACIRVFLQIFVNVYTRERERERERG